MAQVPVVVALDEAAGPLPPQPASPAQITTAAASTDMRLAMEQSCSLGIKVPISRAPPRR